ncbi:MAG TPA: Wzz/FepE/Etk N-terminal domain-containing protein [Rhizomicrobium sp.]
MPPGSEGEVTKKSAIDLREMLQLVLNGWRIVAGAVVVFLLLAVINIHTSPSVFAVTMQVTPVQGSGDHAASRSNSLSSLAQLAGLNLSPSAGQSASQFRTYLDSMHSRALADELAKNKDLMKSIFFREWDEKSQTWQKPQPGLVEVIKGGIMRLLGARPLPWEQPDGARLQEVLNEPGTLEIHQDIKRPDLATIECDSSDPRFAIKLLNAVNQTADNLLRKKALLRATQYIDYLSKELDTVTVAEHRQAIMQALSEQERFKMSASSAAPYAADVFDGPWTSRKRLSPRPSQIYPVAILKGLLFGAAIVLVLEYFGAAIRSQIRNRLPVEKLPPFLRRTLDS